MKRTPSNRHRVCVTLARDPSGNGYAVGIRTINGRRVWTLTRCSDISVLPYEYRTEAEARIAASTGRFAPRAPYRKPVVNSDRYGIAHLFGCPGAA